MALHYEIKQTEIRNAGYPERLLSVSRPPARLYYKGEIGILNRKRTIAVVGSRRASGRGMELAYQTGYVLGKKGYNVVNGLAIGCDTGAFRGALAAGGTCVAVMPCGLEQVVPRINTALAEEILAKGGCLISEYPVRTPIQKYQYIERDRLQSGISDAVIVIEAGYDSGTMHTVRYAIKQGRKLACFDSRYVRNSSGNQWLEEQNGVKVLQATADVNRFIGDAYNSMVYRQMTLDEL